MALKKKRTTKSNNPQVVLNPPIVVPKGQDADMSEGTHLAKIKEIYGRPRT